MSTTPCGGRRPAAMYAFRTMCDRSSCRSEGITLGESLRHSAATSSARASTSVSDEARSIGLVLTLPGDFVVALGQADGVVLLVGQQATLLPLDAEVQATVAVLVQLHVLDVGHLGQRRHLQGVVVPRHLTLGQDQAALQRGLL